MMTRPPRFVWVVLLVALIGLVVVIEAAWIANGINEREARRDCERAVASRADSRTMWLYAIGAAEDPNSAQVRTFTRKLDELLPPLKCEGGNWVPVNSH